MRDIIFKKVLDSIPKKKMIRLSLAPRFGKTKLIVDVIKRDDPETILWVTPSKLLSKEDIPNEFEKWDGKEYLDRLTVTTWSSLKKINGYFDLIVLDEEQFITEKNCEPLLNKKLQGLIISMTGTPTTRADKQELYDKLKLKMAYILSLDEIVELGIVSDYSIKVLVFKMSEEKNIESGSASNRFMTSEASYYRWLDAKAIESYGNNDYQIPWAIVERANYIKNSKTKKLISEEFIQMYQDKRILIFAPFIEYAESICTNTYHSKSVDKSSLDAFQNNEINHLALVKTGSVGFTFFDVDIVLIIQMDSNKTGISTQKIARGLLKSSQEKVQLTNIFVLCLDNTQDTKWVNEGLNDFSKEKIEFLRLD